jgi:hypothetical protein
MDSHASQARTFSARISDRSDTNSTVTVATFNAHPRFNLCSACYSTFYSIGHIYIHRIAAAIII